MKIEQLLKLIEARTKNSPTGIDCEVAPNDPTLHEQNIKNPHRPSVLDSLDTLNTPKAPLKSADILLIAALNNPEAQKLKDSFGNSWTIEGREGVTYRVTSCRLGGIDATVVLAVQNEMGMVPAAILATKSIRAWQPAFIAMTGICAGVRNEVNLGDLVIAKQLLDYGSGKIKEGKLIPDYSPVALDADICGRAIELAGDTALLKEIRDSWPLATGKPDTDLKAHVEAFGSGAAVVTDIRVIEEVKGHKRSLKAIDMEAYAVARSASEASGGPIPCMVVKAVQDFADSYKSDDYREYAAFVSAKFLFRFLERNAVEIVLRRANKLV